jgi:SAM-dependent methyltransferase
MWERIVALYERNLNVRGVVVDLGCGPGRFIDVARTKGAKVIGIDYSAAADVAQTNYAHDPNVCICQADALNLPIKTLSVDAVFSIGVLHHTPNPLNGVREAFRICKENGWFAISVYGKGGYYDFPTVQLWRRFFKVLWPIFGHYPALFYTYATNYTFRPVAKLLPPLGKAIRIFLPFVFLPDMRWSLLDTFDSITPSYQSAHESYEVFNWLKQAGFRCVEPSNWGFSSFTGIRSDDSYCESLA